MARRIQRLGHLLETFVIGELRKQASWLDEPVTLAHWRTSDGADVDLVAEFDDGQVVAFEVQASERATAPAFVGLQQLRDTVGPRFRAGVVLTTGRHSYTYSDRLHVMPIDRLWQPVLNACSVRVVGVFATGVVAVRDGGVRDGGTPPGSRRTKLVDAPEVWG